MKNSDKDRGHFNHSSSNTQKKRRASRSPSPKRGRVHSKAVPSDHKTLLCEITRLKGQEKLLYIKQARQKKYSDKKLFDCYPACKMESFTFDLEQMEGGAEIIRDDNGVHWIQQMKTRSHPGRAEEGDRLMNGWGISIYNDGKIFEGVFHDSLPCGIGYELQPNGNTYVGGFKEGTKQGKGSFYWFSSGEMYTGDWMGGLPHGEGKYLSTDFYEGQFCNGMKYGSGEQVFQNGDRYVGDYINGVADGYGQYFWSDGSVYKGDFKHGVRHGYGIWSDKEQSQVFSGCYRMDKKEGFGIYEWTGKQIYKGQFREDYRQGYGKLVQCVMRLAPQSGNDGEMEEKEVYQGMWMKGKQRSDLAVDKAAEKELEAFLQESKVKPKKKKRVGHTNCIPKE